jgi:hypothetical protein
MRSMCWLLLLRERCDARVGIEGVLNGLATTGSAVADLMRRNLAHLG